ncbi:MAG: shikimate kinase [Planctomycetia bacterium]|nr:shikimate kinase [Planctomycetia bacterium]
MAFPGLVFDDDDCEIRDFYLRIEAMPAADFNIVLIGYRGTGKTSVARKLAAQVGWPWFDSDVEIERAAKKTIAEIFAQDREPAFRDWETQAIEKLSERHGAILATGGGAILRASNRQALARHGRFVWLHATAETIQDRLRIDVTTAARRPSLTGMSELDEIRTLLAERSPIYAALAELTVDTEAKSIEVLASEIVAAWNLPIATEAT